jgi:DNA-binding transcriptional regulator YiaG
VKRPQPWHPAAKLTPAAVAEIRRSNLSQDDLARKFKVCRRTVYRVRIGESWRSIA